jgi:ABC-type methionine transport system permease subunit
MQYVTVVLMILMVQIIQMIFNFVAKRIDKRNR